MTDPNDFLQMITNDPELARPLNDLWQQMTRRLPQQPAAPASPAVSGSADAPPSPTDSSETSGFDQAPLSPVSSESAGAEASGFDRAPLSDGFNRAPRSPTIYDSRKPPPEVAESQQRTIERLADNIEELKRQMKEQAGNSQEMMAAHKLVVGHKNSVIHRLEAQINDLERRFDSIVQPLERLVDSGSSSWARYHSTYSPYKRNRDDHSQDDGDSQDNGDDKKQKARRV